MTSASHPRGLINTLQKPTKPDTSVQDIIKSMVKEHTDKDQLAKHVKMLIQTQAQPAPPPPINTTTTTSTPSTSSLNMTKLQALLAIPTEQSRNPWGGLHLLENLKQEHHRSTIKTPPKEEAKLPKPSKRRNSSSRADKISKKLAAYPRFTPPKKQQKIVYSPSAQVVRVYETPSEVITITPTKQSDGKKRQTRKMSDEAYFPQPTKRPRTKSPMAAKITPPAKKANKGRLPRIRISRKENDGKWRIEPVFICSVPESAIDCTDILDKLSRRIVAPPPPLARAPPIKITLPSNEPTLIIDEGNTPIKITLRVPKNNNQPVPQSTPPTPGLRTTPRKAASAVKYTDPWWDET